MIKLEVVDRRVLRAGRGAYNRDWCNDLIDALEEAGHPTGTVVHVEKPELDVMPRTLVTYFRREVAKRDCNGYKMRVLDDEFYVEYL